MNRVVPSCWNGLHFQSPAKPAAAVVAAAEAPEVQAAPKPTVVPKSPASPAFSAVATKLIENLRKLTKPKRPKKDAGLNAHAKTICGKDVSEAAVVKVLAEMKKAKLIAVDGKGAVSYRV